MNGRMYDFNNGRFLSVDPYIQGTDSNAINPYSYIQNNPLSGVDPTGYLPVAIPIIIKGIGYGLSLWGAEEAGKALGENVAKAELGEISVQDAVVAIGTEAALSTGPGKLTKIVPKSVKDKVKDALGGKPASNNGKPNSQPEGNSNQGDVSDIESQANIEQEIGTPRQRSQAKRRAAREAQREAGVPVSKPGQNTQARGPDQPRHQIKEGADGEPAGVVDGRKDTVNSDDHTKYHVEAGKTKEEAVNKKGTPRLQNGKSKVEYEEDIVREDN